MAKGSVANYDVEKRRENNPRWSITDHFSVPGPEYWSWRCMKCHCNLDDHAPWWAHLLRLVNR